MPRENAKDLRDLPRKVLKAIRICSVEHMDEVLRAALVLPNPDDFLKQPSEPVDWRVPVERRTDRDRRDEPRIPVASAVPPASVGDPDSTAGTVPQAPPVPPAGTEH